MTYGITGRCICPLGSAGDICEKVCELSVFGRTCKERHIRVEEYKPSMVLFPRPSGWKGLHHEEDAAPVTVDQTASSDTPTPVRRYVIGFKDDSALKDGRLQSESKDKGRPLG